MLTKPANTHIQFDFRVYCVVCIKTKWKKGMAKLDAYKTINLYGTFFTYNNILLIKYGEKQCVDRLVSQICDVTFCVLLDVMV